MRPLLQRRALLPSLAAPLTVQTRGIGKIRKKYQGVLERASTQHIDYLRQLDPPRPQRRVNVDPKLLRPWDETRQVFGYPHLMQQPSSEEARLRAPRIALAPKYGGELRSFALEPFGTVKVVHGDIFEAQCDAVILPMSPNLVPYRGMALEALDRGGAELVQRVFAEAKALWEGAKRESATGAKRGTEALISGDVVAVDDTRSDRRIFFVIMPYFWQGSPMDAAKRLRHCVRSALAEVCRQARGPASVAMPSLGNGIFGYEPKDSCRILAEELAEAMMQLDAHAPNYCLKSVQLVDTRRETAEQLEDAMTDVARRWLPSERLTTAAQFYGGQTQRLVVLPAANRFYWKRHPVKFKKNHAVVRKARRNYLGNVVPRLWRPQTMHQPPPLLVHREVDPATGQVRIAERERQLGPRQFYLRGVTHWLFPTRRSGYHALRKSGHGRWVADPRRWRLAPFVKPRM